MEKSIRVVLAYMGLVLAIVGMFFLFGIIGSIENGLTTFADNTALIISSLAVAFVGALLTNVRKDET